tara:strand:- start:44 stop:541 length:498 start_codon:yes stop_codon:yes gene_type:complete
MHECQACGRSEDEEKVDLEKMPCCEEHVCWDFCLYKLTPGEWFCPVCGKQIKITQNEHIKEDVQIEYIEPIVRMAIQIPIFRLQVVDLVKTGKLELALCDGSKLKIITNPNDFTEKDFEFLKQTEDADDETCPICESEVTTHAIYGGRGMRTECIDCGHILRENS